MKILMINSVCGIRSTGRICTDLAQTLEQKGHTVKIAYGRENAPEKYQKYAVRIGSELSVRKNALSCRVLDNDGFAARQATKRFLEWATEYNPDVLHLHNLHGYYINVEMLFDWIKQRPNMKVIWTLHDCWTFTGHCSYFTMVKCEQWKTHCSYCIQKNMYPKSLVVDNCKSNYDRKKAAFTGVKDLTIVTPSKWLAELVGQSFLQEYPVRVIHNGIDTDVFKPTSSDFRKRYEIEDKTVLLGVASTWDKRKGLDDFIKLAGILDDTYKIVLVGLSEKQLKQLPENVIGIVRTNSTKELAEIYTAADVFLNLTYEDNYPTVNLEAQTCGTPCITYNTGGSVESVPGENVAPVGKVEDVIEYVERSRAVGRLAGIMNVSESLAEYAGLYNV